MRGANERLVPILMTAAVTALGLAPLAFGMNQPGQEIEGPMAVTVLGAVVLDPAQSVGAARAGPALCSRAWHLTSGNAAIQSTARCVPADGAAIFD